MIILLTSFCITSISIISLFSCYIYYNSVKDTYVNDDINEFLLSTIIEEYEGDYDENDNNNDNNLNNDNNDNNLNNNNNQNNNNYFNQNNYYY
jgi:hypothetical protein